MAVPDIEPAEVERDRLGQVEELAADSGPGWTDKFRPGTAGCHELLDRTSLLLNTLDQYVVRHPACVANPEWYALAAQAATALSELYQRVGAEHLSADDSGNPDV